MKKQLLILATLLGICLPTLALPASVGAVDVFGPCSTAAQSTDVCTDVKKADTSNPVIHAISVVINIVSILIGIAAVIVIIISGMRLGLSGGDPNSVKTARNGIIYSLVGVAIAAAAQIIVIFVLNKIK